MYVALNPQKARHFTTKGIHLTLMKPIAYVSTELEAEFREKIDEAIRQEVLYVVPDSEAAGMNLAGIGSSSGVEEEAGSVGMMTIDKASSAKDIHVVRDMFGNERRSRKVTYTITLPKEEEEKSSIVLARS